MNRQTPQQRIVGRGANVNPANRFESIRTEDDWEHLTDDDELLAGEKKVPTQFLPDQSRSIIVENDSPDVPFRFGVNVYRGCEHGCAYCYARPYHEMLGMNAGLDFESKILVKFDAANLLRRDLNKPRWCGDMLAMSGATDCYQPAERRFRLTRALLEVMLEARQPVGIVTKNALVTRDLDLLSALAERNLIHVFLSVTTLDTELARTLEPRTSTPNARLQAIAALREAGVPVGAMVAPVVPGLNDLEIPQILQAVQQAGAQVASYVMLRLPLSVAPIFMQWLEEHRPLAAGKIESLIRQSRDGGLNASTFGRRMRGTGEYAESIGRTFSVFAKKLNLTGPLSPLDGSQFRPPRQANGQMHLF